MQQLPATQHWNIGIASCAMLWQLHASSGPTSRRCSCSTTPLATTVSLRTPKIPLDNPNEALRGQTQSMVFPSSHPDAALRGKPKGMRVVLQERGLVDEQGRNRAGKKIPGQCKGCKAKRARKPHLTGPTDDELAADLGEDDDDGEDEDDGEECCLQRLLSREADFRDEPCEPAN